MRTVAEGLGVCDVHPAHRVRLHDALGRAGGARRIDDVERPLGLHLDPARARTRRREPVLQRAAGGGAVEGHAHGRRLRRGTGDFVEQLRRRRVDEDQARAGVGDHRVQALGGRARRQRRHRDAGPQRPQEHRRVLDRGGGHDHDRLARRDRVALQRGRDPVHQRVERAVIHPAAVVRERAIRRALGGVLGDQVGERAKRRGQVGRGERGLVHARRGLVHAGW